MFIPPGPMAIASWASSYICLERHSIDAAFIRLQTVSMSLATWCAAAMNELALSSGGSGQFGQGWTVNSALAAVAGFPSASAATRIDSPETRLPAAIGTKPAKNGGTSVLEYPPQPLGWATALWMQTTPPLGDV